MTVRRPTIRRPLPHAAMPTCCILGLLVTAVAAAPATAAELGVLGGLDVRWDNDIRYSMGVRLASPDPVILSYPNSDDGDRDFAGGLMTNRFDLVSVLDASADNFGAQVSIEVWYDTLYHTGTGNNSAATYNPIAAPSTEFAPAVRDLNGQHVDLSATFVYGNLTIANMPLSLRVGRQTLLWGESLFLTQNGIAAAQAPVDYVKSATTPQGYSKNAFLPVDQISLTLQPAPDLSLSAYYQLEWRASRLPGVGSYFSDYDLLGAGAGRAFLSQGQFLLHVPDEHPPAGGQFGIALHTTINDIDLGFYGLRYDSKYPVLQAYPATPQPSGFAGTFHSYYPAGTDLYGFSFSTYLGDGTLAGEISLRQKMPLVSIRPVSPTLLSPLRDVGYARGDTLHAQISAITTFGPEPWWNSADLSVELGANDRLAVTADAAALGGLRTRFAASVRALFQPHYFQILPNLDVTPSVGIGYHLSGRSSTDYYENVRTGDLEIGVSATYRSVWKGDLTLTSYLGRPYRQTLPDRDFLMLSLERAF